MAIDLKRYYRLYPVGACYAKKEGSTITAYFKRFDPETGVELSMEYNYITETDLLKEKEQLENQLAALNSIMEDIKER